MGEHLNIECSSIFYGENMRNRFKSVICLLLAMVLAITTVVSVAPTEAKAVPFGKVRRDLNLDLRQFV